MIVLIGQPVYRETEAGGVADGLAARIAVAAAGHGRSVQFVGTVGEDETGDAVVMALANGGIGHVALLRQAGRPTSRVSQPDGDEGPIEAATDSPAPSAQPAGLDAADVDLALKYLTEFAVLVLAEGADPAVAGVVATAARWADARLIVIVPAGSTEPLGLPPDAVVFEAPQSDPDDAFAEMVGSFAAALDDGQDPANAFRSTIDSRGWSPAPAD